jgi:hypothetical protein
MWYFLKHETDTEREKNEKRKKTYRSANPTKEWSTAGIGRNGLKEDRRVLYFKHKSG